jgi:membrane protein involved in colicin uptake
MRRNNSICALLVAISISAASAATATASTGIPPSDVGSAQKHERTHRPSLIQIIRYKVMSVVAEAKGAVAETKVRAAMAAKAKAEAKAKAAMEAKRNTASIDGQAPCPSHPENDHSSLASERPSLVDRNSCR